jgi:hypothetical protein
VVDWGRAGFAVVDVEDAGALVLRALAGATNGTMTIHPTSTTAANQHATAF